jgi:hypothetical protein
MKACLCTLLLAFPIFRGLALFRSVLRLTAPDMSPELTRLTEQQNNETVPGALLTRYLSSSAYAEWASFKHRRLRASGEQAEVAQAARQDHQSPPACGMKS